MSCPLCNIPKSEHLLYENGLVYLVETKEKRGHQVRVMSCTKRHSDQPTFEELSLCYIVALEYMKNKVGDNQWFVVGPKYATYKDHFHLMFCDAHSDDAKEMVKLHDTPRALMPITVNTNKVLIGIPAYGEERAVGEVVKIATKYGDVLVIDDGSTDDTSKQAQLAGAKVYKNEKNCGYGCSLAKIFREAKDEGYDVLVTLDADRQHDPTEIPRFLEMLKYVDVAIGNRFSVKLDDITNIPSYRKIGIGFISKHYGVRDSQCGFRAYNRKAIETIDITEQGMGASLEILRQAQDKGLRVSDVLCTVSYDQRAKRNPLRHGSELVETLLWQTIWKNPLRYLGLPSIFLLMLGSISSAMLIHEYIVGHWFVLSWAVLGLGGLVGGLLFGMASILVWSIKRGLAK